MLLRIVRPAAHKRSVFFSMGLRLWYKRVLVSSNDWQSGSQLCLILIPLVKAIYALLMEGTNGRRRTKRIPRRDARKSEVGLARRLGSVVRTEGMKGSMPILF
ncbi:hypothetical protein SLEP1_g58864 [Rubroshorea leprosula]|uniref:Uncharacterized protein n=1 Tax=Rubroshorea leprosula TaxID=152421 RepID=A0AAV5MQR4_9ROSI|nr:hypothetical protein SLEP1_g58864 [Rubroshorea leprosula]